MGIFGRLCKCYLLPRPITKIKFDPMNDPLTRERNSKRLATTQLVVERATHLSMIINFGNRSPMLIANTGNSI